MSYRTLGDICRSLRAYLGNDAATHKAAAVRRAAFAAWERFQQVCNWDYYQTWGRLTTVATYQTGTVAYDHTGGAYERVLTLSGGTWPSWAAYGVVVVSGVLYDVEARKSNTELTLAAATNPGADVAAGATYQLSRVMYDLPTDAVSVDQLVDSTNAMTLRVMQFRDFVLARSNRVGPSRPANYALAGNPARNGRLSFALFPPPDAVYNLEYEYRRRPTMPTLEDESAGTVTVSGATVTGVSTQFENTHVGCVMRFARDAATAPTAGDGTSPFAQEAKVLSVQSATSLTLDASLSTISTPVKYSLSGWLDLPDGPLWNYFVEQCRKALRIECRITLLPEELDAYADAKKAALAAQNQKVTTRRRAGEPTTPTYPGVKVNIQ